MAAPRSATSAEIPAVVALCNRVFRPEGGDMGAQYPLLFDEENASRLITAWDADQPVCHAGYVQRDISLLGASFKVALVGAVCTDASHRGQGLASSVMELLENQARGEGCQLMLVSGGRGLYRRLGCSPAGQFASFRLPLTALPPARDPIRRAQASDIRALVGLHQLSAVRFERSRDDWEAILSAGSLMNVEAKTWIVEHQGAPAAYFGATTPDDHGVSRVFEYGGSTLAVWRGLAGAAEGVKEIEILQMPGDLNLAVLASPPAAVTTRGFPGTVKVLDPAGFFDLAEVLLYERVGQETANDLMLSAPGESVTFGWQGEEITVELRDLPRLLFGNPPGEPPLPFPAVGALPEMLRTLFPLPLVWYGYNYI